MKLLLLRDFVNKEGVCDKCLELFLCEIIEQMEQNVGKICMGGLWLRWCKPVMDMKIFFPGIAGAHQDLFPGISTSRSVPWNHEMNFQKTGNFQD